MARPVGQCKNQGHPTGQTGRCRICAEIAQAERYWCDWVLVEDLLSGRQPYRQPTEMELLVAVRELAPHWNSREQGSIAVRLGVHRKRLDWVHQWAKKWGVEVPSLAEVRYRAWH